MAQNIRFDPLSLKDAITIMKNNEKFFKNRDQQENDTNISSFLNRTKRIYDKKLNKFKEEKAKEKYFSPSDDVMNEILKLFGYENNMTGISPKYQSDKETLFKDLNEAYELVNDLFGYDAEFEEPLLN